VKNLIDESIIIHQKEENQKSIEEDTIIKSFSENLSQIANELNVHSKMVHYESFRLMIKNQFCLYAYWDLHETTKQLVEHHFGLRWEELPKSVKLYEITSRENSIHEQSSLTIEVSNEKKHMFIPNVRSNRTYVAEYGISLKDEPFFSMIRSNEVVTPHIYCHYVERVSGHHNWIKQDPQGQPWHDSFSTYTWYENTKK
jgi:hypothetical protein